MTARISLAQQMEAVQLAAVRQASLATGATVKGLRPRSVEQFDAERLKAAVRHYVWLQEHEAEIRAYFAIASKTAREAAVAMAVEIQRREQVAAAGGPKR